MTGFELFLKKQEARLVDGDEGEFSAYTNVQRTWIVGDMEYPIQIGIIRNESGNFIGVRYPIMINLPREEDYEKFLNFLISISFRPSKDNLYLIIKNK
jgi:hypothetical protein